MKMKNTLVQYQGGGYSGCFWEWNYFFLDKNENFHSIFSSGRDGIKTAEQAKDLFEQAIEVKPGRWTIAQKCGSFYTYDITNDKAIEEFSRECNVVNIADVLQWFNDNPQDGIEFFVLCLECGERQTDMSELSLEEWHGCGGIQSTADKLLCLECHTNGTCGCCNEYVGVDELTYLGDEYNFDNDYANKAARRMLDDGYSDVCEGCLDYQAEQIERDEHEDLRFASWTIGKPDMFSDVMRWYWSTN